MFGQDEKINLFLRQAIREACGDPAPELDQMSLDLGGLEVKDEPMKVGHGGKAKMSRGHLYHIMSRAQSLYDRISDDDELPEWVQSKLAVSEAMINSVYDHLDYKIHRHDAEGVAVSEVKNLIRSVLKEEDEVQKTFDPSALKGITIPKPVEKALAAQNPQAFARLDSIVDDTDNEKHQAIAASAFVMDYADMDPARIEKIFQKMKQILPKMQDAYGKKDEEKSDADSSGSDADSKQSGAPGTGSDFKGF